MKTDSSRDDSLASTGDHDAGTASTEDHDAGTASTEDHDASTEDHCSDSKSADETSVGSLAPMFEAPV
jgi:hypothetical protein